MIHIVGGSAPRRLGGIHIERASDGPPLRGEPWPSLVHLNLDHISTPSTLGFRRTFSSPTALVRSTSGCEVTHISRVTLLIFYILLSEFNL
jgi:hypothetical protein